MTTRPTHVDHPDDERFDDISIRIVPRWKESELSGDEWRFSYLIEARRKGEVIIRSSYARLEWALQALPHALYIAPSSIGDKTFNREAFDRTRRLCDQPGCAELPTVMLQRLKPYNHGAELVARSGIEYRQFCDKHKSRGDCDLDDADHNYEPIAIIGVEAAE